MRSDQSNNVFAKHSTNEIPQQTYIQSKREMFTKSKVASVRNGGHWEYSKGFDCALTERLSFSCFNWIAKGNCGRNVVKNIPVNRPMINHLILNPVNLLNMMDYSEMIENQIARNELEN